MVHGAKPVGRQSEQQKETQAEPVEGSGQPGHAAALLRPQERLEDHAVGQIGVAESLAD